MTGTVIDFPETMQRQWRVFERDIGSTLVQIGVEDVVREHVLSTLKPIFLKHGRPAAFTFSGGDPVDDALQALNDWVREMGSGLLVEIMLREVELYRAGLR